MIRRWWFKLFGYMVTISVEKPVEVKHIPLVLKYCKCDECSAYRKRGING